MRFACIILAAGEGRRAGGYKPLMALACQYRQQIIDRFGSSLCNPIRDTMPAELAKRCATVVTEATRARSGHVYFTLADPGGKAMVSAVFGIVAFLDAPLVWFSIRWWRDIHPSPMLETGGLSPAMRPAFLICLAAFQLLLLYLLRRRFYLQSMSTELEWLERQADTIR